MSQDRENYLRQINRRELYFTIFLILVPIISAVVMYWTMHQDTMKIGVEYLGQKRFDEREKNSIQFSLRIFLINFGIVFLVWLFVRSYFNRSRKSISNMSNDAFQKLDIENTSLRSLNMNKYLPPVTIDDDILIVQKLFGTQRISFVDMKKIGIYKTYGRYGTTVDYVYIKTTKKRYYFLVLGSRETVDNIMNKAREYEGRINIDMDFTWVIGHYISYLTSSK